METDEKLLLKPTTGALVPNMLIKQEMEWLAEDAHTTDLANQEEELDRKPLLSIKTEEDPSHAAAQAFAVQPLTPIPQTHEYVKTEFTLREELRVEMNDSVANGSLRDDQQAGVGISVSGTPTYTSATNEGYKYIITELTTDQVSMEAKYHSDSAATIKDNSHSALANTKGQQPRVRPSAKKMEIGKLLQQILSHCESAYKCEMCTRSFDTIALLKTHLQTHANNGTRDFACHICERAYFTKGHLVHHMKIHECEARFAHQANLKVLMVRKPVSETQQSGLRPGTDTGAKLAKDCNNPIFGTKQLGVTDHQKDAPSEAGTIIKMESMSDQALIEEKNDSTVASQAQTAQRNPPNASEQPQSRVSRAGTDNLNCDRRERIANDMHPVQEYKCELCPLSFKKKGNFKRHMSTHVKDRKREFACQSCKMSYYTKAELTNHVRIHNGSTFNCHLCGICYTQRKNLKTHMLAKHSDEILGPQCTPDAQTPSDTKTEFRSNKKFIDKANAADSIQHAQGRLQPTPSINERQQARVSIAATDSSHMRLKQGKGTHKCEYCPRVFKDAGRLRQHMSTHDKNRKPKYACQSCGNLFYTRRFQCFSFGTCGGSNSKTTGMAQSHTMKSAAHSDHK